MRFDCIVMEMRVHQIGGIAINNIEPLQPYSVEYNLMQFLFANRTLSAAQVHSANECVCLGIYLTIKMGIEFIETIFINSINLMIGLRSAHTNSLC